MKQLFHWLQHIDRRAIYLVLVGVLIYSLIKAKPIDPVVLPSVQDLYTAVDQAPAGPNDGKLILIGVTFSASTLPENGNQLRAIVRHLMLKKKRFAILATAEPLGEQFGRIIVENVAAHYGYVYGKDWISFGYKSGTLGFFSSFPRNIPNSIEFDGKLNQPIGSFPIMKGIKTIKDISLLVEDTSTASMMSWIALVQGKYNVKLGYTCTGVMSAEAYPWLDSKQLLGMAPGMKGAADYEKLADVVEKQAIQRGELKTPYDPKSLTEISMTPARTLMFTQSTAHIVIILFIILGNIGYLLSRRKTGRDTKEAA